MRTYLLFGWALSLSLIGPAYAAEKQGPLIPSPADQPSGLLLMRTVGPSGPGDLQPSIKQFDSKQAQWKHVGDADELVRLETGQHRVGIVYSAGLNIFAAVKMVKADPREEHITTVEISKDRITIVPFVIETSAGGFKWVLTLKEPHVVIPSRYTEGAVDELVAILEDETLRGISPDHLGMLMRELRFLGDPRSIPALQRIAANANYAFWQTTALTTIKEIEKQNRRKNQSDHGND